MRASELLAIAPVSMPEHSLYQTLAAHFAPISLPDLTVTRREFPHWMRPDLQRALESQFASMPHQFHGIRLRDHDVSLRFTDLLDDGDKAPAPGAAEYHDADLGQGERVRCVARGLWLWQLEGERFALLLDVADGYSTPRVRIEIAAASGETATKSAARFAEYLKVCAERGDCWRGKSLLLDRAHEDFEVSPAGLRVADVNPVERHEIVLPEETIALIERNTLGFAAQSQRLAKLGLSAKKGLLLYGPPGTGKTMIVRWLLSAFEGFTKLLVTSEHYRLLSDYLAIARALQPALVVLEDVDLVGADRDGPWASGGTLNTLLNEMDGFAPHARVLFVLTTNRPEVLEPALALRPGRVDQVIEIGLPAQRERRLLVRRYAGALRVDDAQVEETARRVGQASPAFIKELMRRAAQAMLERGAEDEISKSDLDHALKDMLGSSGRLGARILGAEGGFGFSAVN
ncbi:MAG: AAA family ATPase [Burkholderiales bacterium]